MVSIGTNYHKVEENIVELSGKEAFESGKGERLCEGPVGIRFEESKKNQAGYIPFRVGSLITRRYSHNRGENLLGGDRPRLQGTLTGFIKIRLNVWFFDSQRVVARQCGYSNFFISRLRIIAWNHKIFILIHFERFGSDWILNGERQHRRKAPTLLIVLLALFSLVETVMPLLHPQIHIYTLSWLFWGVVVHGNRPANAGSLASFSDCILSNGEIITLESYHRKYIAIHDWSRGFKAHADTKHVSYLNAVVGTDKHAQKAHSYVLYAQWPFFHQIHDAGNKEKRKRRLELAAGERNGGFSLESRNW